MFGKLDLLIVFGYTFLVSCMILMNYFSSLRKNKLIFKLACIGIIL